MYARPIDLDALAWAKPARHTDRVSLKSAFVRAKKLQARYTARLRQVARVIDHLVKGFDAATAQGQTLIQAALRRYRDALHPWAEATADVMVKEVAAADAQAWRRISAEIGRGVAREVESAPIAPAMAEMRREQVRLITSLPTDAADRVGRIVTEGLSTGRRAEDVARDIY